MKGCEGCAGLSAQSRARVGDKARNPPHPALQNRPSALTCENAQGVKGWKGSEFRVPRVREREPPNPPHPSLLTTTRDPPDRALSSGAATVASRSSTRPTRIGVHIVNGGRTWDAHLSSVQATEVHSDLRSDSQPSSWPFPGCGVGRRCRWGYEGSPVGADDQDEHELLAATLLERRSLLAPERCGGLGRRLDRGRRLATA